MSDPMGFFVDDFEGIETSSGLDTSLVPDQYAKLLLEQVTYAKSKNTQTPEVTCRVRCDADLALTPKRGFFHRFYLTPKMQKMVDGFTQAAQLGRLNKAIGESTEGDPRTEVYTDEELDQLGHALAKALTGRYIVGKVGSEIDSKGVYPDKNKIANYYEASESNLTAIRDGGFDAKKITVREVKGVNGKVIKRYLAVKGAASAKPAASAPGVIG